MSDSSDSDDDYLTQRDDRNSSCDREALVRKKLLENFYGKSAAPTVSEDDSLEDDKDEPFSAEPAVGRSDDLDSAAFDFKSYAANRIRNSSVQDLLEAEDRLAREVRTLDSTMQTLVYENYSRFIDATDAIRSIGVNVQANEKGLRRLTEGMEEIDNRSKDIEEALGSLRDQVAEKIRIKRLLTRLDALLKLPQTLREQIKLGKYRTATRSYLSASSILRKHSEGFESLKNIESECFSILAELKKNLKLKILHWSGRITPYDDDDVVGPVDSEDDLLYKNEHMTSTSDRGNSNVPDQPKTMTDIFECAGTLFILLNERQGDSRNSTEITHVDDADVEYESTITADDLQSMAVSASMRLLDRMLDNHLIQVQERRYSFDGSAKLSASMRSISESSEMNPTGEFLIPREFLDAVLEGATLYGMSFCADTGTGSAFLMEFVSEALSSFFSHVRSILYDESIEASRSAAGAEVEDFQDDMNTMRYSEISGALALLVRYVKDLAAGLTLPEVGIHVEFAEKIVSQTQHLMEVMVHRRVDQRFHDLRVSVVKHCLLPFVNRAVDERENAIREGKPVLAQIAHLASNTLSDCLQLVDDAIRSMFSGALGNSSGDSAYVKEAVYASTFRFSSWLANAFEIIAGGESAFSKRMIDVPPFVNNEASSDGEKQTIGNGIADFPDDLIESVSQERVLVDLLDMAKEKLMDVEQKCIHPDFMLAVAELCRFSQESVSENLDQSIATHAGGGRKKSRGFMSTDGSTGQKEQCEVRQIADRFQLATSRVLVLYATNEGMEAGGILCSNLFSLSVRSDDEMPVAPRDEAVEVLRIAKRISISCFDIFGGSKRAGPIPEWEGSTYPVLGALSNRKTGLHLDVERLFKVTTTVYPHPSEAIESSRNAILFLYFKICFRELFENARLCTFSFGGLAQLVVDIEFLKHMVPHYISSDFNEKGNNAISALSSTLRDISEVLEDRLHEGILVDSDDLKRDSHSVLISFMATASESEVVEEFVIPDD